MSFLNRFNPCSKQIEKAVEEQKKIFEKYASVVESEANTSNKKNGDQIRKLTEEKERLETEIQNLRSAQANDNNRSVVNSQLNDKPLINDIPSGGKRKKAKKQKSKKTKKQKNKRRRTRKH